MTGALIPRMRLAALAAAVWVLAAAPAAAQTGAIRGKVVDAKNQPVEGAKITIQSTETAARRHETKSNRRGEFFQIGLAPGSYKVTAEKDNLTQTFEVRVRLGDPIVVNFVLAPGAGGPGGEEAAKKEAELRKAFEDGVALSQSGQDEAAIAKFNEVLAVAPKCASCYANIGAIHLRRKEYDKAEAAYKQAVAVDPDNQLGYMGLVNVYNAQRRFDDAEKVTKELAARQAATNPGGGVSADVAYNAGVVAWNANKFEDARQQFEAAIKADPNHAEAHFMLGKVYVNLGRLPEAATEFETYLKMAPQGPNAKEAQTMYDALKAYIKK
ncbi:MAG TPA: tetratricopeptide repeat protein [Vicinamibacterales bacterium]|nr:tetratricopeptide repeat protein [Vicinamibacterales bacterium]